MTPTRRFEGAKVTALIFKEEEIFMKKSEKMFGAIRRIAIIALVAVIGFFVMGCPDGGGDGSDGGYSGPSFLVNNATEFGYVGRGADNPDGYKGWTLSAHYKLANDITLPATGWTPIGNSAGPFTGRFDGDNKTISMGSSTFNLPAIDEFGLFGRTNGAAIKDLTINVMGTVSVYFENITAPRYAVAGILVSRMDKTVIDGVTVSGSGSITGYFNENGITIPIDGGTDGGSLRVGGIVGRINDTTTNSSKITNSSSSININATITGNYASVYSGGIVGTITLPDTRTSLVTVIDNCNYTGDSSIQNNGYNAWFGGITGQQDYFSRIEKCWAAGNFTVNSNAAWVGGIAARQRNSSALNQCYFASGTVNGQTTGQRVIVGGICGETREGNSTISQCFSSGEVRGYSVSNTSYAGGIVGYNRVGTVQNCFSTGPVSSYGGAPSGSNDTMLGGIAGRNGDGNTSSSGSISNCYALGQLTAGSATANVVHCNAGGIAGFNDYGSIRNCAAIIPNVIINGSGNKHWISLLVTGGAGTLANNVSNSTATESNGLDGQGYPNSTFVKNATIYQSTLQWDFSSVWTWSTSAYSYPILKWMPANSTPGSYDPGDVSGPAVPNGSAGVTVNAQNKLAINAPVTYIFKYTTNDVWSRESASGVSAGAAGYTVAGEDFQETDVTLAGSLVSGAMNFTVDIKPALLFPASAIPDLPASAVTSGSSVKIGFLSLMAQNISGDTIYPPDFYDLKLFVNPRAQQISTNYWELYRDEEYSFVYSEGDVTISGTIPGSNPVAVDIVLHQGWNVICETYATGSDITISAKSKAVPSNAVWVLDPNEYGRNEIPTTWRGTYRSSDAATFTMYNNYGTYANWTGVLLNGTIDKLSVGPGGKVSAAGMGEIGDWVYVTADGARIGFIYNYPGYPQAGRTYTISLGQEAHNEYNKMTTTGEGGIVLNFSGLTIATVGTAFVQGGNIITFWFGGGK